MKKKDNDITDMERELQAARKTISALIARQLESGPVHAGDRFAVFKAMATLENVIANRTRALAVSEQRYRTLYDCAPDMHASIDTDGRITRCNATFERALGVPREELVGRPITALVTADSAAVLEAMLRDHFENQAEPFVTMLSADGRAIVTTMKAVSTIDEEGHDCANLTFRDVTEQRLVERELQHTQRLAAIGELSAGVAHEINNPLTVVRGQADLLMLGTNLTPDQQSRVRTIQQHAMRVASIVSNLQTFARTSAAQLGVVRMDEVVDYALDVTRPRMRTVNVRLQVLGSSESMLVLADQQRLSQVFVNLLNNACDAMDNSGSIDVTLRSDEQLVTVDVQDRGRGIPHEHVDKLFTPFFTTKDVGKGSGLGLSVSYGIVKEYGGQIRAESPSGGGAVFRVTLPRAASPAVLGSGGLIDTPAPHSVASRKGTVVAIVDDEPVIRDLVGTILGDEGYDVHAFPDAREALDHLTETRPDLVITDLRMPGMDGIALRDELIAREPRLSGRVIITTGLVEHAAQDDPNHLPKPFTRAQLLGAVRQCLASDEDALAQPTWRDR